MSDQLALDLDVGALRAPRRVLADVPLAVRVGAALGMIEADPALGATERAELLAAALWPADRVEAG
jgi:hypothetical protein